MRTLTTDALRHSRGFIEVDEAVYFATPFYYGDVHFKRDIRKGYNRAKASGIQMPVPHEATPRFMRPDVSSLAWAYAHDRRLGINPPKWFSVFPHRTQQDISILAAIRHYVDNPTIYPKFELTDFGAVIDHDGIVGDAERAFKIGRLGSIRQLAYLRHPAPKELHGVNGGTSLTFSHTRFLHSENVFLMMNLLIRNNPELWHMKNLLKTAALTHDGMTPAGGDTTKLTDLAWFDEELRYGDYGQAPLVKAFCAHYGVNFNELWDVVQGKGLGGQVLDVADKLGYIGPDVIKYLPGRSMFVERDGGFTQEEKDVIALLKRQPHPCAIWENFLVTKGTAHFKLSKKHQERYAAFWLLRAYAFKNLYYSELARLPDYLLVMDYIRYIIASGQKTREEFLTMTDTTLDEFLYQNFNFREPFPPFEIVETLRCGSNAEAKARAAQVISDDTDLLAVVDNFEVTTGVGCDKFPVSIDGVYRDFAYVFPRETELISHLMRFPKRHNVHILRPEKSFHQTQLNNVRKALIHATFV